MKLSEMRAVHEAATAGEWSAAEDGCGAFVRTSDKSVAPGGVVAGCFDFIATAEAIALYHNSYAKLLAVAEAAKAYVALVSPPPDLEDDEMRLVDALAALESA